VLGLDMMIQEGSLRFFVGMSELFGTDDLIGRLTGMVQSLEAKAEQAEAKAEQAEAKGFRDGVLAVLDARGVPCPDDARSRLLAEGDLSTLRRWLSRAKSASTAAEVLAADVPGT
jgi:hypothetical protein